MKYKLLRALCYLKELLVMLLCKLLGAVCRVFSPAYRGIWLVGERGTDARDNGYWFYRYLRTQHPELRAYYVITADSPDAAKITALGGAVQRCSFRHYLLYYCADYLVGTHVQPCAPDLIVHYHLAAKGIRAGANRCFCSMVSSKTRCNGSTGKICIWTSLSAAQNRNTSISGTPTALRRKYRVILGWRAGITFCRSGKLPAKK